MLPAKARLLLVAAVLTFITSAHAEAADAGAEPGGKDAVSVKTAAPGAVPAGTPADAPGAVPAAVPAAPYPLAPDSLERLVEVGASFVGSSARIGPGASVRLTFRQDDFVTAYSLEEISGPRTVGMFGLGVAKPARRGFNVLATGLLGFDAAATGGMGLHPAVGARVGLEWPVRRHRIDTFAVSLTGITDLTRGPDAYGERLPVVTMWLTGAIGFGFGR
jgi:hypothetical protein